MLTGGFNMKMNINQYVKVRLTEKGKEILLNDHNRIDQQLKESGAKGLGTFILKLDKDGYYKDQLWNIMSVFGDYMLMGTDLPFETEIEIVEESL
jgi:hypothetical protein